MATVRAALSLSSNGVLTSPLSLSVNASLVVDSGSLIRAKVKGVAADTNDLAIYIANQCSERAYLYIKNLETELENYIYIHNDTDTGLVAKIGGGEFAFIPVSPDKKYEVYGTRVDQMIEYGVFGNDNSANPYGGS
jgi:hypothetical protein|tara:strand:- start:1903 stop:2310 length:408 start_codon:yes stop_codon:yes gene_type:complete